MSVVIAESTGTLIEAAATQEVFVVPSASRIAAATRYGVVYASPVDGTETMVNRLFMSVGDARSEAAGYKSARVVRVFVEVADV